uniref:adenylate kinase n=1 Tax=Fagus sylvatica TaxID=28930 RepID=A0A2N9J7G0_FAGSY
MDLHRWGIKREKIISEAVLNHAPPSSPSVLDRKSLPLRHDHHPVQWVFLGCPGVGKGTYASCLSKLLGVPHIATGDLVREELSSSGPLSSQVP